MQDIETIERLAGDDWVLFFHSTDAQGEPEDLTGNTYEGVLVGPTSTEEKIISMDDGASLLDQVNPETRGLFVIKVSKDITKKFLYKVGSAPFTLTTNIENIIVFLKVAQYDQNGNRQTLGTIRIIVKRL